MSESGRRPALPFRESLQQGLAGLEREELLRAPRGAAEGCVSFADNDYLGLRRDSRTCEAAAAATMRWGTGSGSSRLIAGTLELTRRLERELAGFKGYEAALVFPTGYQAAVGCISSLVGPGDEVFLDKLNHASLIDGARLSRARLRTFPHGSVEKLRRLLQRPARGRRLIITDGLFSMDGDLAAISELGALALKYGAGLMVDEAHATGCLGEGGRGSAELLGAESLVAISMGTLSKALGSLGGFVCSSAEVIGTLVNRARSFIYTTAPTPGQLAAALAALEVVRADPQRRRRLGARADRLRERLAGAGFDVGSGCSHILPVILGDNSSALSASGYLLERGYHCPAVRYPTVPRNAARLRLSVCSEHSEEQVEGVVAALEAWREDRR